MSNKNTRLKLKNYTSSNVEVIEMSGNVLQDTADELEEVLYNLFDNGKIHIVVDLEKAENICSSALGLLLNFKKMLNEKGGDLKVVVNSPKIMELFKVTMMDKVFDTLDNLPEALNSF